MTVFYVEKGAFWIREVDLLRIEKKLRSDLGFRASESALKQVERLTKIFNNIANFLHKREVILGMLGMNKAFKKIRREALLKKWQSICTVFLLSLLLLSPLRAFAAVTSQDLNQYIKQTGLSEQELTNYLSDYGMSLNDFNSITDLKHFLGQPLNAQTLPMVLKQFGLTQDQLTQLLAQNGTSLKDYQFVNDLQSDTEFFMLHQELTGFMNQVGLTNQELTNLSNHFESLDLQKITPQLQAIAQNLSSLNFNSTSELSAQDQATITNNLQQLMRLAQINPKIYLQQNNQTQPISLSDLTKLQVPSGANFIVELYDLNGQKLADLTIDPTSLSSYFINQISKIMSLVNMILNNGGQLPNTATHTWDFLALGLLILMLGAVLLKWNRKKCADM